MIIGEAPGKSEDEQGKAFVGRAGKKLDELLQSIGLTEEDVFITNCVCCRPPKNRDPLDDEIKACLPYLVQKIKKQLPTLIILISRFACNVFFGDENIKRGEMFERSGHKFLYIYHPAYLLYNPKKEEIQMNWLNQYKGIIQEIKEERSIKEFMNVL